MRVTLLYGNPHTLTDAGIKLKKPQSRGDMSIAKPHLMVFAPAVLEKVHANLKLKFSKGVMGWLFKNALVSGQAKFDKCDHTYAVTK